MAEGRSNRTTDALGAVRRWSLIACVVLILAALIVLAGGPAGFRAGLVDLDTASRGLPDVAFWLASGAAALAVIAILFAAVRAPKRGVLIGVAVLTASAMTVLRLDQGRRDARLLPPIHDAQTDWSTPVAFTSKALAAREAEGAVAIRDDAVVAEGPWAGRSFAEAQAEAYPLVTPLKVDLSVAEATLAAEEAARRQGWAVMLLDPISGHIEAVAREGLYQLPADIAVRVIEDPQGARIDVRSASRLARPDLGENARRIKGFLDDVALISRARSAAAPDGD